MNAPKSDPISKRDPISMKINKKKLRFLVQKKKKREKERELFQVECGIN